MPNRQRSGRRIRLGSHRALVLLAPAPLGLFALCCLAVVSSARAGSDGGNAQAPPPAGLPQSLPAYLRELTDVGGLRSFLEQRGLTFTFSDYGDAFDNPVGGVKQGPGYDGRFGIIIDGDLDKLVGWSGAKVHASIHNIFGTQFSATNLDNLMVVSGVEAPPTIRLFNLWIEQDLTSKASLRIGQFTAAQEFVVSRNADLFVNSTFGWPMLNTQDLPSGGPNYPEAALGARLQVMFTDQFLLRAAIFDGDPAGSGSNNPVTSDKYGFAFRLRDPPFVIAEAAYAYGGAGLGPAQQNPNQEGDGRYDAGDQAGPRLAASPSALPGVVKIGAWYNAGSFPLQDYTQGSAMPLQRRRGGVWRVRPDTVARARQSKPRARLLCARRRCAERPQRGRSLCRRRLYLPGATRLAAGGHDRACVRLRPDFSRCSRLRPHAGGRRPAHTDPRLRGGDRTDLSVEARRDLVHPAGPAIHLSSWRQYCEPSQPGERIADLKRAGAGAAHGAAVLKRNPKKAAANFSRSGRGLRSRPNVTSLPVRSSQNRVALALPYSHICDMARHMKTTLNIDDTVMANLKREAARQGRTMSELVETALRLMLTSQRKQKALPPLPTFDSGGQLIDIADRDALYDTMERR
jgi:Carbohydrate-selective porin, OprB family